MLVCSVGQSIRCALLPYADLDIQCIHECKYQGRCDTFIATDDEKLCVCKMHSGKRHSENVKRNNEIYLVGFPKEVKT